jgi:hypothetical protein
MSIFQDFSTQGWAIFVKSRRDAGMASISNQNDLGKATNLPGGHFGPICSPFRRLSRADNAFTA